MAEVNVMTAQLRDGAGKGAARATRRAGRVPAVIYGGKQDPKIISLDPRDIVKRVDSGAFFSTVLDIEMDEGKERVLPRDMQVHPINDMPQHLDFLRVTANTKVTVEVPVNFLNEEESPGLKRGGVLNVVRYAIEVICSAENIPMSFDLDLTGLEIGDGLHAGSLSLPDGIELSITDRDFTIATVAAPTVMTAEEEAEEAGESDEGGEGEEGTGDEDDGASDAEESGSND